MLVQVGTGKTVFCCLYKTHFINFKLYETDNEIISGQCLTMSKGRFVLRICLFVNISCGAVESRLVRWMCGDTYLV